MFVKVNLKDTVTFFIGIFIAMFLLTAIILPIVQCNSRKTERDQKFETEKDLDKISENKKKIASIRYTPTQTLQEERLLLFLKIQAKIYQVYSQPNVAGISKLEQYQTYGKVSTFDWDSTRNKLIIAKQTGQLENNMSDAEYYFILHAVYEFNSLNIITTKPKNTQLNKKYENEIIKYSKFNDLPICYLNHQCS